MSQLETSTGTEDSSKPLPGLVGHLQTVKGGMFSHCMVRDFDTKIGVLISHGESKITAFGRAEIEEIPFRASLLVSPQPFFDEGAAMSEENC